MRGALWIPCSILLSTFLPVLLAFDGRNSSEVEVRFKDPEENSTSMAEPLGFMNQMIQLAEPRPNDTDFVPLFDKAWFTETEFNRPEFSEGLFNESSFNQPFLDDTQFNRPGFDESENETESVSNMFDTLNGGRNRSFDNFSSGLLSLIESGRPGPNDTKGRKKRESPYANYGRGTLNLPRLKPKRKAEGDGDDHEED